jgi:hypothetical protein
MTIPDRSDLSREPPAGGYFLRATWMVDDTCTVNPALRPAAPGSLEQRSFAARAPLGEQDRGREILFLGEDNPQSALPEHRLFDHPPRCAGHRLREAILRIPSDLYLACWRGNLCCPSWSEEQASEIAPRVLDADAPWKVVVMLGRKVARVMTRALSLPEMLPFTRHACGDVTLVSFPHPSGRCREWNSAVAYERAIATMRHAAPSFPWGSES